MNSNLGTKLRHLLELLDGELEDVYSASGIAGYRPRYTPIVRALNALGPATIKSIAVHAGISHSAASQTVAQMQRAGYVTTQVGADARERMVVMNRALEKVMPALQTQWRATSAAAKELERELGIELGATLDRAISALERRPFRQRIEKQAGRLKGRKK